MEEKKAETERTEILQKGFVVPQQGMPQPIVNSEQKRPGPPPVPPRPPQPTPIKPPQQTFQPQRFPEAETGPSVQPPTPPTTPRQTTPPPLRPWLPPQPPRIPPAPIPPKRTEGGASTIIQDPKETVSKFVLPPKKRGVFLIKILPIAILILLVGGVSGYWFVIRKGESKLPCLPIICKKQPPSPPLGEPFAPPQPQPQPTPPALPKEKQAPPIGVIQVDKQTVYEIGSVQEVRGVIEEVLKQKEPLHTLESMDFFVANERFLSFSEMAQALGISVPTGLLQTLEPSYTFFRFSQKENGRLGFIAKIKDMAALRQQAASWEKTLVQDSEQFFALLGKQENRGLFKQAVWGGVTFRYFDFLPDKLGIVYAIHPTQNLFIFTSSGESMIDMINRVELK